MEKGRAGQRARRADGLEHPQQPLGRRPFRRPPPRQTGNGCGTPEAHLLKSDPRPPPSYYLGQQVHPVVARLCAPIEVGGAAQREDEGG
jgi:hypothetical protein